MALQMFATFLTSGVTDVDKMLHIYRREGSYFVAFHEFVKSIMLGDRKYYKEDQSPIMNIYDCGADKNSSHFTTIRILDLLLDHRREYSIEGQGYVDLSSLAAIFEDAFDNLSDFMRSINRLVSRQLVEVNTRSIENISGASHVRATSAGWFYSRFLSSSFPYLDLVLQDTPLDDYELERSLRQAVFEVDNLSDREDQKIERMKVRFSRVDSFFNYLENQESHEIVKYNLSGSGNPLSKEFIKQRRSNYENQKDWIQKRLRENRETIAEDISLVNEEDIDKEFDLKTNDFDSTLVSE